MTIEQAHEVLQAVLPPSGTIVISRLQWSRSTVGTASIAHVTNGDWNVTVTIPAEIDRVEAAFGADLRTVVNRVVELIGSAAPPSQVAPSVGLFEREQQKNAS